MPPLRTPWRSPDSPRTIAAGLACAGFWGFASAAPPGLSLFDTSAEGWEVTTRSLTGGYVNEVGRFVPAFVVDGGDPGGHIEVLDPDPGFSFFLAPPPFLGDQSHASGRDLLFSRRTNRLEVIEGRLVIIRAVDGGAISRQTSDPTLNAWNRRRIPLVEGEWRTGAFGVGPVATQAAIDAVLSDVGEVLIGLEFGSQPMEELVGLDRVLLGVCAADIAEPVGVIDIADLLAFIPVWQAGGPGADRTGDGRVNIFDLLDYLADWNAGCG